MDTTEKFLDLYRELEMAGRMNYFQHIPANDNVIGRLLTLPQLKKYKEELNYCRVVRNFLVHNPRIGGKYGVLPSEEMIKLIQDMIHKVNRPPKALDVAIAAKHLLKAHIDTRVTELMHEMNSRAITHVPIVERGKLLGIFSENTIYSYMLKENVIQIDNETTLERFEKYLPIDKHVSEYFEFVNDETLLIEVESLFDKNYKNNKLLSAVFITKDGRAEQPIIGMITPWDVISQTD